MNEHEKLNYVEFPASDLSATKRFFESAFNWTFQDFGPWDDADGALGKYVEQRDDLHTGRTHRLDSDEE